MSHRYKKKAPTTAMYRHFAVVTIVCTMLLAVFADGEKANAVSAQAEQKRVETEQREAAETEDKALPQIQQPGGVWGSDDGGFEAGGLSANVGIPSSSAALEGSLLARYSPEFLARLSEQERTDYLQSMAENGADGSGLAKAQAASIEAQSRHRSGSTGIE